MEDNQEFTYKEFTYKLENGNHTVDCDKPIPKSFYKYYSIDKYKIDAIINNYLYATHPYSFNDSIDSSDLLLDFSNITLERYKGFYVRFMDNEEYQKHNFDELFKEEKKNNFSYLKKLSFQIFSKNFGLISLTTAPINILMWSHYSSESGFAIEIETLELLENLKKLNPDLQNYCLRPIQYVDKLEKIKMFHPSFHTPDIPLLYITSVKRNDWKYEDEWRLSVYKQDMDIPFEFLSPGMDNYKGTQERKLYYSKKTIKSFILGKYFFNGSNCSEVSFDLVFMLKNNDKNKKFVEFVNYIYENYNDILMMSGELETEKSFGRSLTKIKLEKISEYSFKIIDLKETFYKM